MVLDRRGNARYRLQCLARSFPVQGVRPDQPALVTFVVPAYNAEATLQRTFDSARRQTVSGWRLILIDDGSTDGTLTLAQRMGQLDTRISVLQSLRLGAAGARNVGLAAVETEWTVFLDADDTLDADYLYHQLAAMRSSPAAALVCGSYRRLDERGQVVSTVVIRSGRQVQALVRRGSPPCIHAFLCRTLALRATGGFDASLCTNEDWELWLRLLRGPGVVVAAPRAWASYWHRPLSLTKRVHQVLNDRLTVGARHGVPIDVSASVFWLAGIGAAGGLDVSDLALRLPDRATWDVGALAESFCEGASVVTERGELGLVDAWSKLAAFAFAEAVESAQPKLSAAQLLDAIEWAAVRRSSFRGAKALSRSVAIWCDGRRLLRGSGELPNHVPLIVRVPFGRPRSWFTLRVADQSTLDSRFRALIFMNLAKQASKGVRALVKQRLAAP